MRQVLYLALLAILLPRPATAQTPLQVKEWLPTVAGWTLSGEIEVFNPDNLFDRVNGAAPLYIENNFRELSSHEYTRGEEYITVQVYRHATPQDAFGMYAAERSTDLETLSIGGESQADASSLTFFAGHLYVKMWSNNDDNSDTLRAIAAALARAIDPRAGYPGVLALFPAEDKIPCSETYTTANFLGHDFLKGVYSALYRHENTTYRLFVINTGASSLAEQLLLRYFAFTGQPASFEAGELLATDRYNGDIPLLWHGAYILGIVVESGPPLPSAHALLSLLLPRLP
jgi:hypothetical protein